MAYTFVRTSELIESESSEFDLDSARWDLPARRMKMHTPHIVPLSQQSTAVLRALSLLTGNIEQSPQRRVNLLPIALLSGYRLMLSICLCGDGVGR
jgi:integrase